MSDAALQSGAGARHVVAATLIVVVAAAAALIGFGLVPALRERRTALGEIASFRAEIDRLLAPSEEGPLLLRASREETIHNVLLAEQERLLARVRTFRDAGAITEVLPPARSGRIDFKVAMFVARTRLEEKAKACGATLPPDLGLPESIGAGQKTEQRLWQLASAVMLLDRCLERGVQTIESVRALEPVEIPIEPVENGLRMAVFPVEITGTAPEAVWRGALRAFRDQAPFFSLRHILLEGQDPMDPERLRVRAVLGAIRYRTGPPPPPEMEGETTEETPEGTPNGMPPMPPDPNERREGS